MPLMTKKRIQEFEEVFSAPIHPLTGQPDHMLFTARFFCTETECKHYNSECTDGNEHTWVECPKIAEHEMAMRDILNEVQH